MYKLTYYDKTLQEKVTVKIDVDTQRQTHNRANKLLASKDFTKPILERVGE